MPGPRGQHKKIKGEMVAFTTLDLLDETFGSQVAQGTMRRRLTAASLPRHVDEPHAGRVSGRDNPEQAKRASGTRDGWAVVCHIGTRDRQFHRQFLYLKFSKEKILGVENPIDPVPPPAPFPVRNGCRLLWYRGGGKRVPATPVPVGSV